MDNNFGIPRNKSEDEYPSGRKEPTPYRDVGHSSTVPESRYLAPAHLEARGSRYETGPKFTTRSSAPWNYASPAACIISPLYDASTAYATSRRYRSSAANGSLATQKSLGLSEPDPALSVTSASSPDTGYEPPSLARFDLSVLGFPCDDTPPEFGESTGYWPVESHSYPGSHCYEDRQFLWRETDFENAEELEEREKCLAPPKWTAQEVRYRSTSSSKYAAVMGYEWLSLYLTTEDEERETHHYSPDWITEVAGEVKRAKYLRLVKPPPSAPGTRHLESLPLATSRVGATNTHPEQPMPTVGAPVTVTVAPLTAMQASVQTGLAQVDSLSNPPDAPAASISAQSSYLVLLLCGGDRAFVLRLLDMTILQNKNSLRSAFLFRRRWTRQNPVAGLVPWMTVD